MLLEHLKHPLGDTWAHHRTDIIKYTGLVLLALILLLALYQPPTDPVLLELFRVVEKLGVIIAAVSLTLSVYKLITDHNYPKSIWLDAFLYPVNLCLLTLIIIGHL